MALPGLPNLLRRQALEPLHEHMLNKMPRAGQKIIRPDLLRLRRQAMRLNLGDRKHNGRPDKSAMDHDPQGKFIILPMLEERSKVIMHQMIADQPQFVRQGEVFTGDDPVVRRCIDEDQKRLVDQPAGIIDGNDLPALLAGDLALQRDLLLKQADQALLEQNPGQDAGGAEMPEIIVLMRLVQEREDAVGAGCGAFADMEGFVVELLAAGVGLGEELGGVAGRQ